VRQFDVLQTQLRQARARKDWPASLLAAQKLQAFLNDDPDALLEVARAEIRVGNTAAAFDELREYVAMGQATDLPRAATEFEGLARDERFRSIAAGMKANEIPISGTTTAFTLHDTALLAEDIDYDARTKRFYITSVREKEIVSHDAAGGESTFARSPDGWPMVAVKVDSVRGVLWATEAAMQGLRFAPKAAWGKSALLCYRLKDGILLRRIDGPPSSDLGDMLLTKRGEPIVSDGDGGGVYRISSAGSALVRIDAGDFISPQTPAAYPDARHIFVPDYVRGIGVLDIETKKVRWLSGGGRFALEGIDGMYFERERLIAVQNGTSPERVVAFTLNPSRTRIVAERIIARSAATLDPTHAVAIGGFLYYISNSGWSVVDAHGNLNAGAALTLPRVMRYRL
jgi:hypothetical protein